MAEVEMRQKIEKIKECLSRVEAEIQACKRILRGETA